MDGSYCGVLPDPLPPLGLLYLTTLRAKCAKLLSPSECVPSPREYQLCSWCSSHILGHCMPLIILISTCKWLATKNTRECILSRQHVLAFIV
jgi:hypothetical protein